MWDTLFGTVTVVNSFVALVGYVAIGRWARDKRLARQARRQHYAQGGVVPKAVPPQQFASPAVVAYERQPPLSWASQQILNEYTSLPKESQTYGDITETLRALDTKHARHRLNGHFYLRDDEFGGDLRTGGGGRYSWIGATETNVRTSPWTGEVTDRHEHYGCIGAEHYALHLAITDIKDAIRAKEKAIELAGVQHELQQVPTLLEALKNEAEANRP